MNPTARFEPRFRFWLTDEAVSADKNPVIKSGLLRRIMRRLEWQFYLPNSNKKRPDKRGEVQPKEDIVREC